MYETRDMIRYDFNGRMVIVTGGTRGIGAAVSRAFLAAGAQVTAIYGGNDEAAAAFQATLEPELAERLELARLDVSDYEAAEAFYSAYEQRHPVLDILVNSAGIRRDGVLAMMPKESWERVLDVNLKGSYIMSKLAVLRMARRRYGRIVCLSSPCGRIGFEGQANYAASKAGLVGMVKSLSKEVAKRKITVNCVSPGFIDTDFIRDLPAEQRDAYAASVPMRRFGRAEEVAGAVLFLATEESEYVTGTVLEIGGGI